MTCNARGLGALLTLALCATCATLPAGADTSPQPWKTGDAALRGRLLGVFTSEDGSVQLHGGKPHVSDEAGGELSLLWFAAPTLSLELGVAGSVHRVGVAGTRPVVESSIGPVTLPARDISLGEVGLIAPSLAANWHPLPAARVSPYLGAGVGYAVFVADGDRIDYRNSVFPFLRAGVDVHVTPSLSVNLDLRRVWMSTEVTGSYRGRPVSAEIDMDQWVAGLGITFRF